MKICGSPQKFIHVISILVALITDNISRVFEIAAGLNCLGITLRRTAHSNLDKCKDLVPMKTNTVGQLCSKMAHNCFKMVKTSIFLKQVWFCKFSHSVALEST